MTYASDPSALLTALSEQVAALTSSDAWREWLDTAAKFRAYSFNNQLLIMMQRPDATRVAGYKTWTTMGRHVKRGEKGLRILAPCTRRVEDASSGETRTIVAGFKAVSVFDIAQTDGEPLPMLTMPAVTVSDGILYGRLLRLAASLGIEVDTVPDSANGARGWWTPADRRITIVGSYDIASRTRTMLHELSHALDPACAADSDSTSREARELTAESAAYIVGTSLGVEMQEASTFYVASWGGDVKSLSALASQVLTVAGALTDALSSEVDPKEVA